MRILNRDRDIFATMMLKGVSEQEAYGNIYKVYVVGTNCANVDDGLIVTTYNIIKQDGRGCTESTYAVLETPFEVVSRFSSTSIIPASLSAFVIGVSLSAKTTDESKTIKTKAKNKIDFNFFENFIKFPLSICNL